MKTYYLSNICFAYSIKGIFFKSFGEGEFYCPAHPFFPNHRGRGWSDSNVLTIYCGFSFLLFNAVPELIGTGRSDDADPELNRQTGGRLFSTTPQGVKY